MSENQNFVSRLWGFSMWPTIKPGQKVIWTRTPFSALKVGDIIVFRDRFKRNKQVCHRIDEEINQSGKRMLKTKGDNNRFRDREVITSDNYIGRVFMIGAKRI